MEGTQLIYVVEGEYLCAFVSADLTWLVGLQTARTLALILATNL